MSKPFSEEIDSILQDNLWVDVKTGRIKLSGMKQSILTAYKASGKRVIGEIPIYDITDAPSEFIAGYNTMAEATRVLINGQHANLAHEAGEK